MTCECIVPVCRADLLLSMIRSVSTLRFRSIAEAASGGAGPHRDWFPYFTCATDSGNMKRVFDACKQVILKKNLEKLGLT